MKSLQSSLLERFGEHLAAGMFEDINAPLVCRYARGIRRYFENVEAPEHQNGDLLYLATSPWTLSTGKVRFSYTASLVSVDSLEAYYEGCRNDLERNALKMIISELSAFTVNPIPVRFRIGGGGYTHSIIDYRRLLKEGLNAYSAQVDRQLRDCSDKSDFYTALRETLDAVMLFHAKCVKAIKDKAMAEAFKRAVLDGAGNFYEAMLCFNFMFYLDGCDSVGRFDQYVGQYYRNEQNAESLLEELWRNFDNENAWHMTLGGQNAYSEFTSLCIRTLKKYRRPSTGVRVSEDMDDHLWQSIFDNWAAGAANPSLYSEKLYRENVEKYTQVSKSDVDEFVFGGCTELMFGGMSNIGSIDGGVNVLDVFEKCLYNHLEECDSYAQFVEFLKHDMAVCVERCIECVNQNQRQMALFRPQLIRTLFTADCIERGLDFNAGGARYNGSVINVAGLTNVTNSLYTLQKLFAGELELAKEQFLTMLEHDYQDCENVLQQILSLDKFGNGSKEVDAIASEISAFVFDEINKHRCFRGDGFCLPGVIMFVTYADLGRYIGATPDGRRAGSPIADSVGPMQGTAVTGATAIINSCCAVPQERALGTCVLNLRIDRRMLDNHQGRDKLKSLLLTYLTRGGMQVQVTSADISDMKKALEHPELYNDLQIRIGGYSEYFNRLSEILKHEVIRRHENGL